jgi:hypothetical protein
MTSFIQQATRFIDQKIDSMASTMAIHAIHAEFPTPVEKQAIFGSYKDQRTNLVIYNEKALLQNGATTAAIISVALALFSVISFPLAAVGLGGSLAVRYSISQNIDEMLKLKSIPAGTEEKEEIDSRDLKSKVATLASRAGVVLPEGWKPGYAKVLGFPLFRSEIPWDTIFPRSSHGRPVSE